jgi:hypothetical protein
VPTGTHEALPDGRNASVEGGVSGASLPPQRPDGVLRLSMWSGPRNVSTALMYSFRQRGDTRVVDEPLYGHYLRVTGARHPAAREVMTQMECDGEVVVRRMVGEPVEARVLFFKNMAHHLTDLDRSFLPKLTHALLTRDPREMLPSLARVLPSPTLADTGLVQQCEILDHELAAGRTPLVIDARDLLLDPPGVLGQACSRLGLEFDAAMLSWPAGPKPEDGRWAPHWYANVHRSTGFAPYREPDGDFPEELAELLEECRPYYRRLHPYALSDATGEPAGADSADRRSQR